MGKHQQSTIRPIVLLHYLTATQSVSQSKTAMVVTRFWVPPKNGWANSLGNLIREISTHKGQGREPILNTCDLRSRRRHFFENKHDSS